jgi:hypothetical protein
VAEPLTWCASGALSCLNSCATGFRSWCRVPVSRVGASREFLNTAASPFASSHT